MVCSIRRAAAFRSSSSIVAMAPSAAAQATGLPPYVPPRPPPCGASIISARPTTAASGRPPAMPLATVTRSGTTPSCSQANQAPVRHMPDWISSATNTTPLSRHQSAIAARNPGAGTTKPPSPSTGSITTQARLSAPTCFSITSIARAAACAPVISVGSRNG